jgi:hypothetical protein
MVRMGNADTLRKSRAMFSERHGLPGDLNYYVWLEQALGLEVVRNRELLTWVAREKAQQLPESRKSHG